jgi:chromosome segregation ATPase
MQLLELARSRCEQLEEHKQNLQRAVAEETARADGLASLLTTTRANAEAASKANSDKEAELTATIAHLQSQAGEHVGTIEHLRAQVATLEEAQHSITSVNIRHLQGELDKVRALRIIFKLLVRIWPRFWFLQAIGERNHWMKKAESMSKDIQRMMKQSAAQEEVNALRTRVEQLEHECEAYREAMQKAMEESVASTSGPSTGLRRFTKR